MLEIGSLVDGKYKILNKIGQGGMSIVYLAMNEKANKQWAIKEVRKDGIKDFEVVKQGLIVETEMLKCLNHPNLPSIIDVIEDESTFLIVMDYIQGNPLSKTLEEYGAQPQENVIEWAKQLCDVLGYLHTREPAIIYRDMKPANIMLKPDGNLTLIDFGTARVFKEKNIADTTCLGTVGYAAPEQFGGQGQTDARTDIYCLGTTLYHLVTGLNPCEPPYDIRPIREINVALSSGLERIIMKCTQRNPGDRYQSCAELMYALEHYEEIDDIYRKRQKKKLSGFVTCMVLTVLFAAVSTFGYVSAENKLNENYDVKLIEASNGRLKVEQQTDLLVEAVKIDPSDTRAYLQLLDLFVKDDNELSKEEASVLIQLKAGLDVKNRMGYSATIYPFEELRLKNPKGYAQVCYEIGIAFWYEYMVSTDRYSSSVEWFNEAVSRYPIAKTYIKIGECQQQIKEYSGQNRTEKMYTSYKNLWKNLKVLLSDTAFIKDNDTKLLAWNEIVNTTSSKAAYFITNISAKDMIAMMDDVSSKASKLKNTTRYDAVKDIIDKILADATDAKERIGAANSNNVHGK